MSLVHQSDSEAVRQDDWGVVVSVSAVPELDLPAPLTPVAVRQYFREVAEQQQGGLVEAEIVEWRSGKVVEGICKRPNGTGFTFIGMVFVPMTKSSLVWAVAATEGPMTGMRESVVTTQMLQQGALTVETYQQSWAQDPYDPAYRGLGRVDSKTLRYLSDDAIFDSQFPNHPLTRVRACIRQILDEVDIDEGVFGSVRDTVTPVKPPASYEGP
jgi:hypothetical protein